MSTNPESDPPAPENTPSENLPPGFPPRPTVTGDELLPPVEPPSAGFIIQLFVVPAVIVACVVALWVMVTMLATAGDEDPTKIVAALRGSNQARWQKADELANMLRLEARYPELKHNSELAQELAKLLEEEVEAGRDDQNSINLRYYLARVLGEFYVDDGVGVLLETARSDPQRDVRREAINALAVLGQARSDMEPPRKLEHPELAETFVTLANDQDDLVRSQTAFALGVLARGSGADPALQVELEKLVDDLYSDARYNAALGLARQGNLRAVEAVVEMMDPAALETNTKSEKTPALAAFKRDTILDNALDAAKLLIEKNPEAKLDDLRAAVKRVAETGADWQPTPVPKSLVERANALLAE